MTSLTGRRVIVTNTMTATMLDPRGTTTPVTGETVTETKIAVPKGIKATVLCSKRNLIQYSPLPDEPQSYDKGERDRNGHRKSRPRQFIEPMLVQVPDYNWKWLEPIRVTDKEKYWSLLHILNRIERELVDKSSNEVRLLLEGEPCIGKNIEARQHFANLEYLLNQLQMDAFGPHCP